MTQYGLTEEQRLLQEMVRRFAREKVAPRAHAIDEQGEYPQDLFDAMKDLGLFALPFPESYGGANSILSGCIATEELARICYNTSYLLAVQWTPFGALLSGGSEKQKQKFLPGLASGAMRGAISITEPGGGSDVAGITTRADRVQGGYLINGTKSFATGSLMADFVILAAKTDPAQRHRGISVFVLEKGMKGFEVGPGERNMASRAIPSSPIYLNDCFVPEENRMGPEGDGFLLMMEALNASRPIIGAMGVGMAQGAMDLAVQYVRERQAFGQAISEFQGVQWMIADMAIQTEAARQLVYKAAAEADKGVSGKALAPLASMAKCFASDVAMKVATDAVQLFGSAGISKDNRIEQFMRDAKVLQIFEGTNQIQRNVIGKHVIRSY